jgi:hypothetical protein
MDLQLHRKNPRQNLRSRKELIITSSEFLVSTKIVCWNSSLRLRVKLARNSLTHHGYKILFAFRIVSDKGHYQTLSSPMHRPTLPRLYWTPSLWLRRGGRQLEHYVPSVPLRRL